MDFTQRAHRPGSAPAHSASARRATGRATDDLGAGVERPGRSRRLPGAAAPVLEDAQRVFGRGRGRGHARGAARAGARIPRAPAGGDVSRTPAHPGGGRIPLHRADRGPGGPVRRMAPAVRGGARRLRARGPGRRGPVPPRDSRARRQVRVRDELGGRLAARRRAGARRRQARAGVRARAGRLRGERRGPHRHLHGSGGARGDAHPLRRAPLDRRNEAAAPGAGALRHGPAS